MSKKQILSIVGPTGVGKTAIGLKIAEQLDGEIISADSRQIYKEMSIGTDKPDMECLKRVRHHFIDYIDPSEDYNAGLFSKDARKCIGEIISRGKLPLMVGGSGLYVKSVLDGFFEEPEIDLAVRKQIQGRVSTEPREKLHKELKEIDPVFAEKVTVNDLQRIARGLEVYYSTGNPLSDLWKLKSNDSVIESLTFGIMRERSLLYERINRRVDLMLEKGLIKEVQALKEKYPASLNAFRTYGYQEVFEYLDGKTSYDEMVSIIKQRSRNFAKRQITWFKKLDGLEWINVADSVDDIIAEIIKKNTTDYA